ncbi:MAG: type II toxin-antitoxin system PemK/MazF family toxin [Pirellulales bacterium]
MPDQGDIVLVPVPFTDLSSQKRCPVIIVSNDVYNHSAPDVVVVAMTSNPAAVPYSFRIRSTDLAEGALNRPGTVRADKIYTLAKSIIVKKFGRVSAGVLDEIRRNIVDLTAQ